MKINRELIVGISSASKDKKHIIMLDYDHISEKNAVKSIKELQFFYHLGQAHLFKTTKGYHVYFLSKVDFFRFIRIAVSSLCERAWLSAQLGNSDKDFKLGLNMKGRRRHFVLRLTKKKNKTIKYIKSINSKYNVYSQSKAHKLMLEKLALPKKIKFKGKFDKSNKIILVRYFS